MTMAASERVVTLVFFASAGLGLLAAFAGMNAAAWMEAREFIEGGYDALFFKGIAALFPIQITSGLVSLALRDKLRKAGAKPSEFGLF